MNSCREFEGKNVDAAIDLACKKLNISKNDIKYNVISTGSTGIFSIIRRKKAKISVVLQKEKAESVSSIVDEAFGIVKKFKVKQQDKKPEKQTKSFPNDNLAKNNKKPVQKKSFEKPKPEIDNTKNNNHVNGDKYPARDKIISGFYGDKSSEEIGKEVISKVIKYISSDIEIKTETENDVITYYITGGDSAIIIGKRGKTLESIQYLVDKIVNKHTLERKRVQIDVEGYLEKRKENLEKMALRMSEKVVRTGKPSTISQMSSQDRRIIHLTLKENKQIRTQSMGEGYYRRLVIFPKRNKKRVKN